ncbi:MAG: hypothetical protein ACLGI6_12965, partial [Gammaproteobacteria bacterium]
MKKLVAAAMIAASTWAGAAQASVHTFEFTGTLYWLSIEGNGNGWEPSTTVKAGDTYIGRFTLDTSTPVLANYPYGVEYGGGGAGAFEYTITQSGLHYVRDEIPGVVVYNDTQAGGVIVNDGFSIGYGQHLDHETAGILLVDNTATVFNNTAIPTQLDRARFDLGGLITGWDSPLGFVRARGTIDGLHEVSAVPEPSTYAMLLA